MPVRNIYERFFEKVCLDASGCWFWEGARAKAGYGTFNLGRRGDGYITAHTFTYEMIFGPVPLLQELDHLCRIRHCCNPWHLEAVPHRINIMRGMSPNVITARTGICHRGHVIDDIPKIHNSSGAQCRACARLRKRVAYIRPRDLAQITDRLTQRSPAC